MEAEESDVDGARSRKRAAFSRRSAFRPTINVEIIMSRGLGKVQRGLITALEAKPDGRFTIMELAQAVYPNQAIKRTHLASVGRALRNLPGFDLQRTCEGRFGRGGWRRRIRWV
jgi:hypothetical protein